MNKPFWVELGMMGIKSRSAALAWFYLSIASAIFLPFSMFVSSALILETSLARAVTVGLITAAGCLFACLWYWFCIRWMDTNRGWTK